MKFPSLEWYDYHNVPYLAIDQRWEGPIWTGHEMILSTREYGGSDAVFFHELCHFLAADPSQWPWPDLALDRVTNGTGDPVAIYGLQKFTDLNDLPDRRGWAGEECIPPEEAYAQEMIACDAMFFYEPIVLGNWEGGAPDEAFEFSGGHGLDLSQERLDNLYEFLREAFYVDLTREEFDAFHQHLLDTYPRDW